MRVTGGVWGSRRLRGPTRGQKLRPTPDAMRERCFAVLGARVDGARVLDLFAGTGAVGIEALSRGAATAVLVDVHPSAVRLIRANLDSLGVGRDRAEVLGRSAAAAVAELGRAARTFDLIWADPPFESWNLGLEALAAAVEVGLGGPGAVLCLECPARADVAATLPESLAIERDLAGGASRVVILRIR
ncbi:MAG: RsmD family RNA methyltransferase [Thermoanaerobaculales bacterium]|nr:RsmD family RNA methyltransferase [Thermoanaerobaculales bacterium]